MDEIKEEDILSSEDIFQTKTQKLVLRIHTYVDKVIRVMLYPFVVIGLVKDKPDPIPLVNEYQYLTEEEIQKRYFK